MSVVLGRLPARLWVLGAFVLCGCYTYVPVERPAPGTPVRVRMPVSSAVEGSSRIPESVMMEGRVIAFTDTLRMEMRNEQRMGTRSFVAVDTVRIAASSLTDVEKRVFSRGRTAVFMAALLGGVALATWGIAAVTGEDGGGKPDPPPTAVIFGSFGHGLRFFGTAVPFRDARPAASGPRPGPRLPRRRPSGGVRPGERHRAGRRLRQHAGRAPSGRHGLSLAHRPPGRDGRRRDLPHRGLPPAPLEGSDRSWGQSPQYI